MFGNEFGGACGDGKWVDIGVKAIDAFIKGVNMHVGAIAIGGEAGAGVEVGGKLEIEGNV
jgi:hypothetical protein